MSGTRPYRGKLYPVSAAHPVADLFPWLADDELEALAADIQENGQHEDIDRLPDGRIVDGRNRELACRVIGVEPKYRTASGLSESKIVALIVSANLRRRDLSASQRALIAADLANIKRGDNQHSEGAHRCAPSAVSQEKAAEKLDVSRRSVQSAAKVKDQAPELVEAVRDGKIDLSTAAKAAELPAAKRQEIAESSNPKSSAKKALAKKRHAKKAAPAKSDEPTHPLLDLRARIIALTQDVNKALNANDAAAVRLRALMHASGVVLFSNGKERCEFQPLLGIPLLLAMATENGKLPSEANIKLKYLEAAGAWVSPTVAAIREQNAQKKSGRR